MPSASARAGSCIVDRIELAKVRLPRTAAAYPMKTRLTVAGVFSLLCCAAALAQELTPAEKERATEHLRATQAALLASVDALTPEQWNFKPGPDRWSIGNVVEHLAATELQMLGMVETQVMKAPARTESVDVSELDGQILQGIADRSFKVKAPEALVPTNRFGSPQAALQAFRDVRARTLAFLANTPDLRGHATDSPLGQQLDAYQWLLFISAHCERHTKQIVEVKTDANFPAAPGSSAKPSTGARQ